MGRPLKYVSLSIVVPYKMVDYIKKKYNRHRDAKCPQCGTKFKTGYGTGRRLDAKFCCDEHSALWNSRARSKTHRS
jgi:hypothetical protein